MNDAFDYMEIEEETIKMRIFAQSLGGEVKKWFKNLAPHSKMISLIYIKHS